MSRIIEECEEKSENVVFLDLKGASGTSGRFVVTEFKTIKEKMAALVQLTELAC